MLAVSLEGFVNYQRNEAWTWEHMALCRARPMFGSTEGASGSPTLIAIDPVGATRSREDSRRRREDARRHDAAQAAGRAARHQAWAGRAGRSRIRGSHAAADARQRARSAARDAIEELAEHGLIDPSYRPRPAIAEPDAGRDAAGRAATATSRPKSRAGWSRRCAGTIAGTSLLAAHDEARQRIAALWKSVREAQMINEGDKAPALKVTASDGSDRRSVARPASRWCSISIPRTTRRAARSRRRISPQLAPRLQKGGREGRRRVARPDEEA